MIEHNDYEYEINSNWRQQAACKEIETDDFFPHKVNKNNINKIRSLFETCNNCTVINECFYEAVINDHHGIWAATFHKERVIWADHMKKTGEPITYQSCCEFVAANTNRQVFIKIRSSDV